MKRGFFVAGTDTGIGKTWISAALIHRLAKLGKSVSGMKPVAAGGGDTEKLAAHSSSPAPKPLFNPYRLTQAAAPHIAADLDGVSIDLEKILAAYRQIQADYVIVEGVGGFKVPLNAAQDTSDLVTLLGLPVILVVGMRLGCINHALLTADAIKAKGLNLIGWVANTIDPAMPFMAESILSIQDRVGAPLMGIAPFGPDPATISATLDISAILR